jgi:hypothetical protein
VINGATMPSCIHCPVSYFLLFPCKIIGRRSIEAQKEPRKNTKKQAEIFSGLCGRYSTFRYLQPSKRKLTNQDIFS